MLFDISSPKDLRGMSDGELQQLSDEIREYLINSLSKTGGHLASNLGAVELTVALHSSFDCPTDKIVFDVGHQCYTHKILTGRAQEMNRLRKKGGPSGFPTMSESAYDAFGTGHAGTSVSAALGMARARDIKGEDYHVVAVVGDGALGNGMIYEAINDADNTGSRLIIILNDNTMSISKNVGAISNALRRMRMSKGYFSVKKWLHRGIDAMPRLHEFLHRIKTAIKYLVIPGVLFEELGLMYMGPIDGHNIAGMRKAFERAKSINEPVLIHVITKKGHGYKAAEKDPTRYHSAQKYTISTGSMHMRPVDRLPFTGEVSETLTRLAAGDRRICAITAAMADATGLAEFRELYPDRFFDVGIAEEHALTMAAGLASMGMRPFVAIYSTFLQRGYDEMIHDICLQKLPVVILDDHAGITGDDGQTHQGVFDVSFFRHIPNLTLLSPAEPSELTQAMEYALSIDSPCVIRYPKGDNGLIAPNVQKAPFPEWRRLTDGKDVAIIALGVMAKQAMEAQKLLSARGISAAVYSARSVKPLDERLLAEALQKKYVATLEDNMLEGGFASLVLEEANRLRIPKHIMTFGVPDRFLPHETRSQWLADLGIDGTSVARSIISEMSLETINEEET